jgi:hypothetical protein
VIVETEPVSEGLGAGFSNGSEFIADGGLLLGPVPDSTTQADEMVRSRRTAGTDCGAARRAIWLADTLGVRGQFARG